MREMIKMVLVLTILSSLSGGLLASIYDNTKERIEIQELTFVKGPAILSILEGASNDPIIDRFKLVYQDTETSFFVGVYDQKPKAVAFEVYGKGYGGDIGVMVGVDTESDTIVGVSVTTHLETPGIGAKAKTDPGFTAQFAAMPILQTFDVKTAGGQVDAMSGATITSRGVSGAMTEAGKIYQALKPNILEALQRFSNQGD